MPPARRASSSSRGATSARALASSADSSWSPSTPPFTTSAGLSRAKLAEGLGHRDGVAPVGGHEGDGRRPGEHLVELEAQLAGREAHQGVLVDLVLATGLAQGPAQRGHVADVDAAVLGEQRRAGAARSASAPPRPRRPSRVSGCPSHLLSIVSSGPGPVSVGGPGAAAGQRPGAPRPPTERRRGVRRVCANAPCCGGSPRQAGRGPFTAPRGDRMSAASGLRLWCPAERRARAGEDSGRRSRRPTGVRRRRAPRRRPTRGRGRSGRPGPWWTRG